MGNILIATLNSLRRNRTSDFTVYLDLTKVDYVVISLVCSISWCSSTKVTPLLEAGESFTFQYLGKSKSDFRKKQGRCIFEAEDKEVETIKVLYICV